LATWQKLATHNNDHFTAVVRDYPGEPVPEETLTHPLTWRKLSESFLS